MCVPIIHVNRRIVLHELIKATLLRGVDQAKLLEDGDKRCEFMLEYIHDKRWWRHVIVELAPRKTYIA